MVLVKDVTLIDNHTFNHDVWNIIQNWDFTDVHRYVLKKFPEMDVDLAVEEYKHWIYLLACVSERLFAPNPDLDQVWHAHILHTRDYLRFCNLTRGEFIHHQHVEVDCHSKRREQLCKAAKLAFNDVPFRCDLTVCSDHYCHDMTM